MKKNNYEIKTEIVSISKDLIPFFEALSIALGEEKILELWEKAYKTHKKNKHETKN